MSVKHRILQALQDGLPVSATPFGDVAREVGVPVETLLGTLRAWKQDGVLRRMGAIVDHVRVGVTSAMVVWEVPAERRAEVGMLFAGFSEVSHAYERQTQPSWPYSLYTMVHGDTPEHVQGAVKRMSEAAGLTEYVVLATQRELKKAAPRYVD